MAKTQHRPASREDLDRLQEVVYWSQADAGLRASIAHELRILLINPLPGWMVPADLKTFDAIAIQREILGILRAATTGEKVRVNLRLTRQMWRDARIAKGVLLSTSSESTRDFALHRLLGLLDRAGAERIRECPETKCGRRLFIKVTNKDFCSTRCQSRAWMRQERAKQSGGTHGKKTRAR